MQLFNQFSAFVIFVIPVGLLLLAAFLRPFPTLRRYLFIIGVLLAATLALFFVGSRVEGDTAASVEGLLVGSGRPVLLELYSNY